MTTAQQVTILLKKRVCKVLLTLQNTSYNCPLAIGRLLIVQIGSLTHDLLSEQWSGLQGHRRGSASVALILFTTR